MDKSTPDWADKIIELSRMVEAPDMEIPEAFKLAHPHAEAIVKLTWKLGYLRGLSDATNVIDEESVNIAMETLREWAGHE